MSMPSLEPEETPLLAGRRQILHQAPRRQCLENGLQGGQVRQRLHPARPRTQLALGLWSAQQQLGHDRKLDLAHLHPVVKRVLPPRDPATPLDKDDRTLFAQTVQGVFHVILVVVLDRVAVGL